MKTGYYAYSSQEPCRLTGSVRGRFAPQYTLARFMNDIQLASPFYSSSKMR